VTGIALTALLFAFGVRRLPGLQPPAADPYRRSHRLFARLPDQQRPCRPAWAKRPSILPVLWFVILGVTIALLAGMTFLVVAETFIPSGSTPGPLYLARGAHNGLGRTERCSQIGRILVGRGLPPYLRGGRRAELRTSDGRARLADSVRLAVEEGGVTFVKLGQVLATRRDLLPDGLSPALLLVPVAAPPSPRRGLAGTDPRRLAGQRHPRHDAARRRNRWAAWAEQKISAGTAALLLASVPVCMPRSAHVRMSVGLAGGHGGCGRPVRARVSARRSASGSRYRPAMRRTRSAASAAGIPAAVTNSGRPEDPRTTGTAWVAVRKRDLATPITGMPNSAGARAPRPGNALRPGKRHGVAYQGRLERAAVTAVTITAGSTERDVLDAFPTKPSRSSLTLRIEAL
jgi:hypothetical protein